MKRTICVFVAGASLGLCHQSVAFGATKAEVADPALISSVALPNSGFVLQASNKDTEASVQLAKGLQLSPSFKLFFAGKASAPLTSSGSTTLASEAGIANSGRLRLSLSPTYWRTQAMPQGPDPQHIKEVCMTYLGKPECTRQDLKGEEAKAEFDAGIDYGWPVFGTVALEFGREAFDYRDGATLAPQSRTRFPLSLGASLGVFLPSFGYAGASYEHRIDFDAGVSTTLCEPYPGVAGTTTCDNATIGKPTRSNTNRVSVEARWFTPHFAANPTVRTDTGDWTWTFRLPVYFIADAGAAFIGGIAPSYSTGSKDLTVTLFVGTALSKAPGL